MRVHLGQVPVQIVGEIGVARGGRAGVARIDVGGVRRPELVHAGLIGEQRGQSDERGKPPTARGQAEPPPGRTPAGPGGKAEEQMKQSPVHGGKRTPCDGDWRAAKRRQSAIICRQLNGPHFDSRCFKVINVLFGGFLRLFRVQSLC